jgi:hypothetical protein
MFVSSNEEGTFVGPSAEIGRGDYALYNTKEMHNFLDYYISFFLSWRDSPLVGLGLLIHEVCFSRSHRTTHHSR